MSTEDTFTVTGTADTVADIDAPSSADFEPTTDGQTVRFHWRCPICGAARMAAYGAHETYRAVNDLRTHIRSTDGDGHAAAYDFPEHLDRSALTAYVKRLS